MACASARAMFLYGGQTLLVACGDIFPRPGEVFPLRGRPWQRGQVSSSPVTGQKKPAVKLQTFRLCQSLSLSGEVARRSRDGEGCLPERTLSVSLRSTALPKGEPLAEPESFVLHSSTAGRSQPISGKLYAPAKASPFRERWHGEAVTERVASGTNPLSLAALDSSPEGRALGRTGEFRPPFVNGRKKSADKR